MTTTDDATTITTTDVEWDAPAAFLPRDGWERPLIELPDRSDTCAYQRASTFAGYLSDASALRKWESRQLVLGMSQNPDLAELGATMEYGTDNRQLDDIVNRALDRSGTKRKADYGSALHRATEPGAPQEFLSPGLRADVESYQATLDRHGIRVVATEQFVVNDQFRVAGTFDHIVDVPGFGLVVADKKTGQGMHPGQHAMQLAVYAGGVFYDHTAPQGAKRTPLPPVRQDLALLIRVPAGSGKTELHWLDLEAGREGIALALAVKAWRSAERSRARAFADVQPLPEAAAADRQAVSPEHEPAPVADRQAVSAPYAETVPAEQLVMTELGGTELTLTDQLATAMSSQELDRLWERNRDHWTPEHTQVARARAQVLGAR